MRLGSVLRCLFGVLLLGSVPMLVAVFGWLYFATDGFDDGVADGGGSRLGGSLWLFYAGLFISVTIGLLLPWVLGWLVTVGKLSNVKPLRVLS